MLYYMEFDDEHKDIDRSCSSFQGQNRPFIPGLRTAKEMRKDVYEAMKRILRQRASEQKRADLMEERAAKIKAAARDLQTRMTAISKELAAKKKVAKKRS